MTVRKQTKGEVPAIGEVVFRFLEGENEGVEIRVSPPRELVIGRSEECDIFLGEKKISRKHCRILVNEEGIHAKDLQSTNGTFVNKKKIGDAELKDGDKLQLGTTVIAVSIGAQKEALPPGTAESIPKAEEPPAEAERDSNSGVIDVSLDSAFEREEAAAEPPAEKPKAEEEKKPKPLSGNLSAMGLADLLQNLAQNRKSGILHLSSHRDGRITVVEGKVLGADVGRTEGVKALYRMLGWNEGEFELHPLPGSFDASKIQNPITDSMETLLMEGFRQYDELEKIRKSLPPASATLKLKPRFTAPLSKLHPRVLDVLQAILNEGKFESVLDASPFSDLETSKIVFYLVKKEYIVAE